MTDRSSANKQYLAAQQRMGLLSNYYEWIISNFRSYLHGTLYDLGCGDGLGIPYYLTSANKIIAVDHDSSLLKSISERFDRDSVTSCEADLEGDWVEQMPQPADAVVALDIVEHIENDYRFVEQVGSLLRPGGTFVMKVPAHKKWYSHIDQASGHVRRYEKSRVLALADSAELRMRQCARFNVLGGVAYKIKRDKARTNFSRTFSPWQLRLINLCIPVARAVDYLPFGAGLSWVIVMEKPNR